MATKIKPFNLHTTVDTHVQGLIDSSYILLRSPAGIDSGEVTGLIDSSYISLRQDAADSASINTIITTTTISSTRVKAEFPRSSLVAKYSISFFFKVNII